MCDHAEYQPGCGDCRRDGDEVGAWGALRGELAVAQAEVERLRQEVRDLTVVPGETYAVLAGVVGFVPTVDRELTRLAQEVVAGKAKTEEKGRRCARALEGLMLLGSPGCWCGRLRGAHSESCTAARAALEAWGGSGLAAP